MKLSLGPLGVAAIPVALGVAFVLTAAAATGCAASTAGPSGTDDAGPSSSSSSSSGSGSGLGSSDAGDAASADASYGTPTCPAPAVATQCKDGYCALPAGCLVMGSPEGEPCRTNIPDMNEETVHEVTLTHAFEIGEREVTRAEFSARMGYDPSKQKGCGDDCPVDGVSWDEAAAYCVALSVSKGLDACYACTGTGKDVDCTGASAKPLSPYACNGYRLPTEAEWEYAYRAGTRHASYAGPVTSCAGPDPSADAIGWYSKNAGGLKHAGKAKRPNGFGIHDMAGNVGEWCHDRFVGDLGTASVTDPTGGTSGDSRVVRGGAYDQGPGNMRASARVSSDRGYDLGRGVRCARTL